jgi:uncharacterized coiled-coil protein SlyX
MSQYRDHRDAARHRVDALESKLAERDAALAAQGAELAEREAEVVRLRRELDRAGTTLGPHRAKPVSDAWTGRVVGAAVGLSMLAAILGVVVMRGAPASVVVVSAPTLADPAVVASPPSPEIAAPVEAPRVPRFDRVPFEASTDEEILRRQLEPKVWSGHASVDEIRMLKAICSHMGDHACRDRAAAMLATRADRPGL